MSESENESVVGPVPVYDVARALIRNGCSDTVAWWLAHLDRKVWEMEQRLKALERSDVTG